MQSKFKGNVLEFIGMHIAVAFICICTLGIGFPFALVWYQTWLKKNTVVDGRPLTFDGKGIRLFFKCIKWAIYTVCTFGIYALWIPLNVQNWVAEHTHMA